MNALTTVIVPKSGGVTSTKAVVVRWLKKEGDKVKVGEPLVELETEKVSFELESPAAGTVRKLFAQELSPLIRLSLAELQPRKEPVLIAGVVLGVRVQTSGQA